MSDQTITMHALSLRDYFAGQALAGMLANPGCSGALNAMTRCAYEYANGMLEERTKTPRETVTVRVVP